MDYGEYAKLLVNYCLEINKGDRLLVRTSYLAEPLLQELFKQVYDAGGIMETMIEIQDQSDLILANSDDEQLRYISPLLDYAFHNFETYLYISAPFNLALNQAIPRSKTKISRDAKRDLMKVYSKRTSSRELRRSLCVFPCNSLAQNAKMSLQDFENFVMKGCKLDQEDPIAAWKALGQKQAGIVEMLNQAKKIQYKNNHNTDITFSTNGRIWINSDGKTNMPSGEVYTSPVEDSVNGTIHFDIPSHYLGRDVEDVTLEVINGEVVDYSAKIGQDVLEEVFTMKGSKVFGEAAIGTNYDIQQVSKQILFDEKIGGTIHMALGQSYLHTGGKNESSVHWDLISSMKEGGKIFADDRLVYENGYFIES